MEWAAIAGDGGPAPQAELYGPASRRIRQGGQHVYRRLSESEDPQSYSGWNHQHIAGSHRARAERWRRWPPTRCIGGTYDLFVDPAGNVFLTDVVFNRVREILSSAPSFQVEPLQPCFYRARRIHAGCSKRQSRAVRFPEFPLPPPPVRLAIGSSSPQPPGSCRCLWDDRRPIASFPPAPIKERSLSALPMHPVYVDHQCFADHHRRRTAQP